MCIIFAAFFILRGRDTHIDFLRFISGRHDFLSDANPESIFFETQTSPLQLKETFVLPGSEWLKAIFFCP